MRSAASPFHSDDVRAAIELVRRGGNVSVALAEALAASDLVTDAERTELVAAARARLDGLRVGLAPVRLSPH